jgi:hypothetical protein
VTAGTKAKVAKSTTGKVAKATTSTKLAKVAAKPKATIRKRNT